jgi:hypothetical protein
METSSINKGTTSGHDLPNQTKSDFLRKNFFLFLDRLKIFAVSVKGRKLIVAMACLFVVFCLIIFNNLAQERKMAQLYLIGKNNSQILDLQNKINELENQIQNRDAPISNKSLDNDSISLSYLSSFRLRVISDAVIKESFTNPIYVTITSQGELKTSEDRKERQIPRTPFFQSKPFNFVKDQKNNVIIGSLEKYSPQVELINPMIYEGQLYAISGSYIVNIAQKNAYYVSMPKKNIPANSLDATSFLLPSPDNKWLAVSLTSFNAGSRYYSTIMITDKDLSDFSILYWEDSEFKPTQKIVEESEELFSPGMHLLGWSADSSWLYVTWELSALGPPPFSGSAKIDLNGKFVDTGLAKSLTPIAFSPNEKYIFATSYLLGDKDPVIFNIESKEVVRIPLKNTIANDDIAKSGNTRKERGLAKRVGADAYFSADSEYLFFKIIFNLDNTRKVERSYKFNTTSKKIEEAN